MSIDRLDRTLQAAIAAGVLPATAARPLQEDARPWPVVLLTALGAWLAALPLLGVVGLLLGDLVNRGVGPYVVGMLALAGAVVVLRSREVALFVEQLAVPALLVGGGTLGFGLFRDLPTQAAAAMLALVALALAVVLPRTWLRVLLGAAAAMLAAIAWVPQHWGDFGHSGIARWWAWHACFALWAGAQWLLHDVLVRGARARGAAALEPLAAGWLLATLGGLAWWSGMSFLVGASLGGGLIGEVARELGTRRAFGWQPSSLQFVSAGLAVIAALWGARRWAALRRPWCGGVAAVLLGLAWCLPALGAVLLALTHCATTQRWRLASAAAVAAAWIIGSFYYQLHWPLATKAVVLAAAGAALGALSWLAHRHGTRSVAPLAPTPTPRAARAGIALSAVAVLAAASLGIWQKEDLIARGQPVYVELAPVDPRSLMQGDYMRLNFRVPADVETKLDSLVTLRRPRVVAQRDARGVAVLKRLDDGSPPAPDELRIELTPKDGRWFLVSDAWYFKEGEVERWAAAKYGEFRVATDGRALLVGLADAQLRAIPR